MPRIKSTLIMIVFLLSSACGYHLRENIDLPEGLNSIYLQGGTGQLRNNLKKVLRSSSGKLAENSKQAGLVVKVIKEKLGRNVLSLNERGRANEYELYYRLKFLLLDAEGKQLSTVQDIEIQRDYFNNQEEVLGKNIEEGIIRDEMYRQAVQSIFSRARVVLEKHQSN